MTTADIIRGCRAILRDGGDPNPCERGQWCPYCCMAIAKGDLDDREGNTAPVAERIAVVLRVAPPTEFDAPTIAARKLLKRPAPTLGAGPYTRESALAVVESALAGI